MYCSRHGPFGYLWLPIIIIIIIIISFPWAFSGECRSSTGQAAVHPHPQCCRPTRVLSQVLRTHHPTSPWPSLVAGPGTDSIPSLRSGIPLPQWISAAISCWELSSNGQCGRSSPPLLIYHHDACPVSAVINSWWPCLSCHCIAGMEQPTTCHLNCFHPSPLFGNNWRHICLGLDLANFLLPSSLFSVKCPCIVRVTASLKSVHW